MWISDDEIRKLFTYRRWTQEEVDAYRPLREDAMALALKINSIVPECPQKSRAINALHESVYLINTAVSLYPKDSG